MYRNDRYNMNNIIDRHCRTSNGPISILTGLLIMITLDVKQ